MEPEKFNAKQQYKMEVRNTTLDDLASIIGFTATLRLAAWYGDSNLYVAATIAEDQRLVALIGEPAARRLSDEFGRQHIWVPGLHAAHREKRNHLIWTRLMEGAGSKAIAKETGLTERRVLQMRVQFERMGLIPMVLGKSGKNALGKTTGENG